MSRGRFFFMAGFSLAVLFLVGWFLFYPFINVIEFDIAGHTGDEEVSVSKNWGYQEILPKMKIGTDRTSIKILSYGPVMNIQIHFPNLNSPPRMATLHSGVVRVRRENILGKIVDRCDWLNVHSQYITHHGEILEEASAKMATIRSGYSGWSGHYNLTSC
jgi:hypothetical protein